MTQPQLAIIIVTWNTRELVLQAVGSALADLADAPVRGEIWVVDNCSTDGTAEALRAHYPLVHLLQSDVNLGFAGGNNAALHALGYPDAPQLPDFVLLLNPDTDVRPSAIAALLHGMASTGSGLAGPRLVYSDGSFQHSAFAFPGLLQLAIDLFPFPPRVHESRLNGRYPRRLYEGRQPFEVDFPLGAAWLLRCDVIRQTGLFDEQFHLYCEEIDWAMRIKSAGYRVVCVPAAEIVHYGGQSTSQVRPRSIINLWKARLLLARKHYDPVRRAMARIVIRAGMNRLIRLTARDSSQPDDFRKSMVDAYQEVIRLTHQM